MVRVRVLALMFAALLLVGCGTTSTSLATVNGQRITQADLTKRVDLYKLFSPPSEAKVLSQNSIKQAILDRLVEEDLLLHQAQVHHITVTKTQVQNALSQIQSSLVPGVYADQAAYAAALKKYNLTVADVSAYVQRVVTLDAVLAKEVPPPSAKAIAAYYQAHKKDFTSPAEKEVRHILVASKTLAESILAKLKAGQSFSALAKKYSIDPGSKDQGGMLGFIDPTTMVPSFAKAVESLKPGQMSGIVHSRYGYHIIEVLAERPAGYQTLAQATPTITNTLSGQADSSYVARLKAKAHIHEVTIGKK